MFGVILVIGLLVCCGKLLRFRHTEKEGFRNAAQWLMTNTAKTDVITVPDIRIVYYAERDGIIYKGQSIQHDADFIVKINDKYVDGEEKGVEIKYSTWLNNKKKEKLEIYKVVH